MDSSFFQILGFEGGRLILMLNLCFVLVCCNREINILLNMIEYIIKLEEFKFKERIEVINDNI